MPAFLQRCRSVACPSGLGEALAIANNALRIVAPTKK